MVYPNQPLDTTVVTNTISPMLYTEVSEFGNKAKPDPLTKK